jgi:hypothetical protein
VSPSSPPEVEIEALRKMVLDLAYTCNNMPQHLTDEKYKELKDRLHRAVRSVNFRQRYLKEQLAITEKAVKNLAARMQAAAQAGSQSETPPTELLPSSPPQPASAASGSIPALSTRRNPRRNAVSPGIFAFQGQQRGSVFADPVVAVASGFGRLACGRRRVEMPTPSSLSGTNHSQAPEPIHLIGLGGFRCLARKR